jgi:hypothetical protein
MLLIGLNYSEIPPKEVIYFFSYNEGTYKLPTNNVILKPISLS